MSGPPSESARVRARASRGVGHLTLRRPDALNALDIGMVRGLRHALETWREDDALECLVLDGEGDRGFCAGGDVRALADDIAAGRTEAAGEFFRAEYALIAAIAEYPKPIVALADGITMGGGVGLAGHATVRVVTERSRVAMPETRIGFTPDVGATHLLARAPGRVGEYLALTGASMSAADAIHAGFADLLVPSEQLGALRVALHDRTATGGAREIVNRFAVPHGAAELDRRRSFIDAAFAGRDVAEIVAALRERAEPAAVETAALLDSLSPTALSVTLASVRAARARPGVREALDREYGLVMWFVRTQPDLLEGIRARLIDRDVAPRWRPATLSELSPDVVDRALSSHPEPPLWA